MTEDTSPENLRKFLESDDPALVMMGLSMAKGQGETPIIAGIATWYDDAKIRMYAKKILRKNSPEEYNIVNDNWETKYNKIKTWDSIVNRVENLFEKVKTTKINTPYFWKFALNRSQTGGIPYNVENEIVGFGEGFEYDTWHLAIISILVRFNNEEAAAIILDSIDFYDGKKYWNRRDKKYNIIDSRKFYAGLIFIGKPAVPLLLKKMENDGTISDEIIEALGNINIDDLRAIGPLIKALNEEKDSDIVTEALKKLGHEVE
jgi:hypothetical protein